MTTPDAIADSQRSCAGIVTFQPDIERLAANLAAIAPQVAHVVIVDNGSTNVSDILALCSTAACEVELIRNTQNLGIARALNQACQAAVGRSFEWMVLLDQDSVAPVGMVRELEAHRAPDVGLSTPQIIDRGKLGVEPSEPDGAVYTLHTAARKSAITSGSLVSLSAYSQVGGFDDSLFIDYVDYDFNKRLLLAGYKIIRSGRTHLLHECGQMVPTVLWVPRRDQLGHWHFERFFSFGHSAFRCYYKARNRVIFTRKYWREAGWHEFAGVFQLPFVIALTLAFEPDRWAKAGSFARGLRDGVRAPLAGSGRDETSRQETGNEAAHDARGDS